MMSSPEESGQDDTAKHDASTPPKSEASSHAGESVHDNPPPQNASDPQNVEKDGDADAAANPEAAAPTRSAEAPLHSIFPKRTKIFIVCMTVASSIFSPFTNFVYLPALNALAADLAVTVADINFSITSYQILQGIAPLFFGDLADRAGRRPVYLLTFAIYAGANVGLALQDNYAALLVLRALQSTGSSATIAIGNGVVADVFTSAERGGFVGWVQSGIQVAPALAPVVGGILTQFLGWRAIFWFLVIASGLYVVAYALFVPETSRTVVGNGSVPAQGVNRPLLGAFAPPRDKVDAKRAEEGPAKRRLTLPNPLPSLRIVFEKDVAIVLFFISLLVTFFYTLIVPFPGILAQNYGFNDLQVGLCYMCAQFPLPVSWSAPRADASRSPFSVGAMLGSITGGHVLDWRFRRVARAVGVTPDRKRSASLRHFPIERARLGVAWAPALATAATTAAWGWVLAARPPLAAPLVVMFVDGAAMSAAQAMGTTLLVDLYPQSPATVSASLNICRCLMAAAGSAAVQYVIDAWGLGWTYTFCGLVLAACMPLLWVLARWGPRWREERWVRLERREEERTRKKEEKSAARREEGGDGRGGRSGVGAVDDKDTQ